MGGFRGGQGGPGRAVRPCRVGGGGLLCPLPCRDGGGWDGGGRGGSVPQSVTDYEVLELELNEQ